MSTRLTRCRMTDRLHNPCTAEALDPDAPVLICTRHAALVLALINQRIELPEEKAA